MKYINGEYINGADLYGTQLQKQKTTRKSLYKHPERAYWNINLQKLAYF